MPDEEAFTAYVRARWAPMVRSLVLMGCPRQEAEDVVQSALARCYAVWERVERAQDPDGYVYRALLNTWAGSRRRRWWGELPTDQLPDAVDGRSLDSAELRHSLVSALAHLSLEHRQVLVLRYVADLSESQVAEALGVPVGTVKSRVARAVALVDREALREGAP